MKSLPPGLLLLLLVIISAGCKKTNEQHVITESNDRLLTEKSWRLVSYGRDLNNNSLVDPSEESIKNCERDNTYSFVPDGSGVMAENTEICQGQTAISSFQWSFINNETGIDFVAGIANIMKLTADSMVLSENNAGPGKLILTYTH